MDSEQSENNIQLNPQTNSSFFEGLVHAPRLTQKQRLLRTSMQQDSNLKTKQTSLSQKVIKLNHNRNVISPLSPQLRITALKPPKRSSQKVKYTKSFEDLKLIKALLKAIHQIGYPQPTPIQQLAIPPILSGKDVVASSLTGSGKTAAFLIPIIQRYYNASAVGYIRALIVTPTRELAMQIYEQFSVLNKYARLEAVLVIGASAIHKQEISLRNHPELVIGTPGRIIDLLMNSRSIGIEELEMVVFDEADKLLEMGFEAEIKQIVSFAPESTQTILFSATMAQEVQKLALVTTRKPIRISADPHNKTAEKLHQQIVKLKDEEDRYILSNVGIYYLIQATLLAIILNLGKDSKTIVFFKTKKQCHRIATILSLLQIPCCELHGNLAQSQRIDSYLQFKEGLKPILLATDLAARGLDIKEVTTVINYEVPAQLTKYIHRVGRTARAGQQGTSLTLCSDAQCLNIKRMCRKTGDQLYRLNIHAHSIAAQRNQITRLEYSIRCIAEQEREERDIRKAEMEVNKLQNITLHSEEIYSKPKKLWFISEKEKKMIKEQSNEGRRGQ